MQILRLLTCEIFLLPIHQMDDFVNFKNAYFYDSNLSFGIFYESRGLPYWGFAFTISDFSFGVFDNADLSDADLTMANFSNAKIVQSNLSGSLNTSPMLILAIRLYRWSTLGMRFLTILIFRETTMDRSSLESLSRASSLKKVDFSGLDLIFHDLNFSGIDLSGSNFSESNLSGVDFTGAKLDDTDLC